MEKWAGKQLLLEEVPLTRAELLQYEAEGRLTLVPGMDGGQCQRCGNRRPHLLGSFLCARCGTDCLYCRHCIMMGRVSACTTLVRWKADSLLAPAAARLLSWEGTLSPGQEAASAAVVQAVREKSSCLVWAVCGAGKTEVLFAGIEAALQRGERVCLATPRTDVVLELAPRLRAVFPHTDTAALYGGSPDRNSSAQLVIATTHQLFRYYQAFDTVILDEADAFPYSADATLQLAVERARKEVSAMVYLTATPSEAWQRDVRRGRRKAVTIPARYHGQPLPVPSFAWCGNWQRLVQKGKLPPPVLRWAAAHLAAERPVFLFVPHIRYIKPVVALLGGLDERIAGVHAEDRERKEKVAAFRSGAIPLLVTTTILERGVTVPNLQVAVMGAEDPLFTESALVQIAGRAGRSAKFPDGDVVLFHFGRTEAMEAARQHILAMNAKARKLGWVR